MDVAGNARFAKFLIEFAEEEREYRLDTSGKLDNPTVEDLQALTADDVRKAASRLLRKLQPDGALLVEALSPNGGGAK